MNPVWIAGNAFSIVTALICMSYLTYVRCKLDKTRFPVIALGLIAVTATITALQFIYPELLALFRRNPDTFCFSEDKRLTTTIGKRIRASSRLYSDPSPNPN